MASKNEANKGLIEKINNVEKEQSRTFSNAILDVLYGKITLTTLEQHFEKATESTSEYVNVEVGDEINYREVIMHKDDKPLIYALSYVPLKRVSNEIREDLIRADIPIGRILKSYKIESRREINNIYIEKPNETLKNLFKTDEDMLARDYVIINNNDILMWIKEVFPISSFTKI